VADRKQNDLEAYVREEDLDRMARWVEKVLGPLARADDGRCLSRFFGRSLGIASVG
jgi:hypothetical protein